jgi:hypothetical protein
MPSMRRTPQKVGQQIARGHGARELPKRRVAEEHPQRFHAQRLQGELSARRLLAHARVGRSLQGEIQRHRLEMRVAQQGVNCLDLLAKQRVILVRLDVSQGWTQPALNRYSWADGRLFCHRNQIMAAVFWPKPGNPPGFGHYHFT